MTPETPRNRRAFLHGGLWTMGLRGATIVGTLTGARFLVAPEAPLSAIGRGHTAT